MHIDYWPSRPGPRGGRNTSWSGNRRSFPTAVREAILRRDPICRWPGCDKPSEVADHIINVAEARRLGWSEDEIHDISNGQGLCNEHHNLKSEEERIRGIKRKLRTRERERHPGLL